MIPPLKLDHLIRMTDEFGMFQFASGTTPNVDFGYTLDDNARALIVCSWLIQNDNKKELVGLISIYFDFVKKCLQANGIFVNYIDFEGKVPSKQNTNENLEDVQGRVLWALAEVIINTSLSLPLRTEAEKLFLISFKQSRTFTHLRAQAFAIKAFALAQKKIPSLQKELLETIKKYADNLIHSFQKNSDKSWVWFENKFTYNNGILPESLLIASELISDNTYSEVGEKTLRFLIGITYIDDKYVPIGNAHWYEKNKIRSMFDQQPEDPASMILVLNQAYKLTGNEEYKKFVRQCFEWFLGENTSGLPLYDKTTFGCHDGLNKNGVNGDQGAESLISYLMSYHIANALR
ncbi:MAG: hypothetical protein NTZ55_02920 [Candidatus Roizmanbacteria bacterium]|nr:hypothetical protein [Candidatus Roizmanbacteria bacterium]